MGMRRGGMEGMKLDSKNTVRAQLKRTDYPVRKAVWKGRSLIQGIQDGLSPSGLSIQRGRRYGGTGKDYEDRIAGVILVRQR
jgi:hypothetical protein